MMSTVLDTTMITRVPNTLPVDANQTQAPRYAALSNTDPQPTIGSSNQKKATAVMPELTTEAQSDPVTIQTMVLGSSMVAATPTGFTRAATPSQNVVFPVMHPPSFLPVKQAACGFRWRPTERDQGLHAR